MTNKYLNFLTGLFGFISWFYLSKISPEHSLVIASGVLLTLIGFSGAETIKDILKTWKQ